MSEKKYRWDTSLEKDVFIKGLVLQYWLSSGLTTIPVKIWKDMNILISSMYVFPFLPKQPSVGVLMKSCPENMQQIYRRTPMPKCDFNNVAKQLY